MIPVPLIAAPMAAVSHAAFRRLVAGFAPPDEYFSEMIHAPTLLSGNRFETFYTRTAPDPSRLVWQLTAPDAASMAAAVPIVYAHGGIGIDINMGCSAPAIVRSGAGIAWMYKPAHEVKKLIRAIRSEMSRSAAANNRPMRLSVKLRLGKEKAYLPLKHFCTLLTDEGVQLLTLHPRTQRQSYGRPAFHEYTARLAQDMRVPVYGSGDIVDAASLQRLSTQFPAAGWMIGRAAVQKPWLFAELNPAIKKPFTVDLLKTAEEFLTLLKEEQPPEFYKTRAARFFSWYCDNVQFAHYVKTQVANTPCIDGIPAVLKRYFDETPADRCITVGG